MKNKKLFFKNQKGSISMIGIILTIIIVTMIAGFISLNKSSWTASELQSVIDISSINALNGSIDEAKLKEQVFAVKGTNASIDTKTSPMNIVYDTAEVNRVVGSNFQKELNKQVSVNHMIKSIAVKKANAELVLTDWGTNASAKKKARPQLTLDSVVQVVIENTAEFDTAGSHVLNYKDAKTGAITSITVDGVTKDGNVVLTVRCLTRIVYR